MILLNNETLSAECYKILSLGIASQPAAGKTYSQVRNTRLALQGSKCEILQQIHIDSA